MSDDIFRSTWGDRAADALNEMIPARTAVRVGAAGVPPVGFAAHRRGHTRGNIAIPAAVFVVTLRLLRRWWT